MTLDEIRALDREATPGPWKKAPLPGGWGVHFLLRANDEKLADVTYTRDCLFIVAARSLLLPLAEENAKLRAVAEAAKVVAFHSDAIGVPALELALAALEAP